MSRMSPSESTRLKILYLSHIDVARPYTGSARRIQDTLKQLAAKHEVHLAYVLTPPGAVGSEVHPQLPGDLASATGVARGGLAAKFFNFRLWRLADRMTRTRGFDLVIVEHGEAGLYGVALTLLRRVPFVYMVANIESRLHLERGPHTLSRRAFARFLDFAERLSARHAALVTTCTPSDAEVVRSWRRSAPVTVLPGGFEASKFNPTGAVSSDPPKLVFLGNMTYEPNREAAQFIIDHVMAPVLQAHPQAVFQFVGVHEAGFEATAPAAQFTGYVEDLSRCLKEARLVLVPVRTGGGMRIKTIEALACGKMVIAADRGADGIDLDRVRRIRSVAREDFAQAILDELEHGVGDDDVDFAYLKSQYSTEETLERFGNALVELVRRRRGSPGLTTAVAGSTSGS